MNDDPNVSDPAPGPGWWVADDGKWYSPERRVGDSTAPPPLEPVAATPAAPVVSDIPEAPGWWMADDGKWYTPELRVGESTAPPSLDAHEPVVDGDGADAIGTTSAVQVGVPAKETTGSAPAAVVEPLAPVGSPAGGQRPTGMIALAAIIAVGVALGVGAALVLLDRGDGDDVEADGQGEVVRGADDNEAFRERADDVDDVDEVDAAGGVVVDGDGWTATFPGEVTTETGGGTSRFLPGQAGDDYLGVAWESDSGDEGLGVFTARLPPDAVEVMAMVGATEFLDLMRTAFTSDPTVRSVSGSPLLDADVSFQGRDALHVQSDQPDSSIDMLIVFDGERMHMLVYGSDGGNTTSLEAFVENFEFTG